MCNGFRILYTALGALAVVMFFFLRSISAAAEDPFSGPYIGLQAAQSHLAIGYDYRALFSYHEYNDLDASGYEGGVYFGYGRTIGNFYVGLQGDYLIGTASSDSGARFPPDSERRFGEAASYGIAGRAGYNLNDKALPYILFGWQHIDIDVTQDYSGTAFDQRFSVGLDGMRFGAGIEFPLLPHVLARMEYGQTIYPDLLVPYPELGSAERNKVIGGTGRVGIAYNFGAPSFGGTGKTSPALISSTADSFDGFYLGLEGGAEMANLHFQYVDPTPYSPYADPGAKGFVGGVFAGYGKTFGNIYTGVQAEFTVSTATQNEGRHSFDYERRFGIGPYGGATGRLGYVMANTVMPYLMGGWRRANFSISQHYGVEALDRRITTTRDGWVIGLGTEIMVAKNISLRLEYDQATYQSIRVSYPAFNSHDQIDPVTNTGRIGVAYRF